MNGLYLFWDDCGFDQISESSDGWIDIFRVDDHLFLVERDPV
jgi:hypothetical protein